ncbi:MAG: radical SAM protein [bacterium]|nr:radical SAM protein [bacterium]
MNPEKVLLIYPPNQLNPIETPRRGESLGMYYLAAALERGGFEADILDATVGTKDDPLEGTFFNPQMQPNGLVRFGLTVERISEIISQGDYGVVGIHSNFTPQTNMAFDVAAAAKAVSRNILVLAGGVNTRNLVGRFLKTGNVDAICLTEGEKIIVNMVRAHAEGKNLHDVSGIARLSHGNIVYQPVLPTDVYRNLDELPVPAWHKMPFCHYDRIISPRGVLGGRKRYAPYMSSRGCPYECEYCHISWEKAHRDESGDIGSLRLKSVPRVIEELHHLRGLGITQISFEDDSLLAHKGRVRELFTQVRGLGLELSDINGVNLVHFLKREGGQLVIDREYLELLRSAGFAEIVCPVESASQRILDKYATGKLNHSKLDVVELIRVMTDVGITCLTNIMMGFPDETEAEILASIELGKHLVEAGAAYVTYFAVIPFPGCMLHEYALANGHLDPDFDTDRMNWKYPVMKNTVVPPERVNELREWGWQYANTKEHVRQRLEASAGHRWQSGAPTAA